MDGRGRVFDNIFIELQSEILELLDAERMTLYAVDHEKKELYSKFMTLATVKEIRVPISEKSIAGYATLTRQVVNIADAYDKAELGRMSPALAFDRQRRRGTRDRSMPGAPCARDARAARRGR
jgi:hypothetical protein